MKLFRLLYSQIDLKNCIITFRDNSVDPNLLQVKIGEGSLTYDEKKARQYIKNRGQLANVRDGDQDPVDVKFDFTWEFLKGDSEITPEDALKQRGNAASWTTSGADPCEPYCIDIVIENLVPCTSIKDEVILLSEFRYESLNHDLRAGSVSVTGKCNVTQATVTRVPTNTVTSVVRFGNDAIYRFTFSSTYLSSASWVGYAVSWDGIHWINTTVSLNEISSTVIDIEFDNTGQTGRALYWRVKSSDGMTFTNGGLLADGTGSIP